MAENGGQGSRKQHLARCGVGVAKTAGGNLEENLVPLRRSQINILDRERTALVIYYSSLYLHVNTSLAI